MSKSETTPRLEATCRVALAAYLHDLGKFAERARLEVETGRLESHLTQYCPFQKAGGWHSHRHAAYTALAWDIIEQRFPGLVGNDVFPFAAWNSTDVDDSIVNAAARHHKPETFLQWIVATADRVASGFEREEFEAYNAAEDKTREGRNHYTARQLTLFEQIRLGQEGDTRAGVGKGELEYRYALQPMTVQSLFPVAAQTCEYADNKRAQAEYGELWEKFLASLASIPESHRSNWPLWLDHFDSSWSCYTHTIPAATAFGTRPEVSLYDHSHTTAALATALWRYHHDSNHDIATVRKRLANPSRPDWKEQKLLLVQGDFFGIQEFIFASGGDTQKRAARLLRGRSFYVSLLTECAALRILEALDLPATSQVTNAAGKFLIVAPNTEETVATLERVQKELDLWFLEHAYGQSGIGIAWLPVACNDFLSGRSEKSSPFGELMKRLFEQLQEAKTRRFDLCAEGAPAALFGDYLSRFDPDLGECRIDGRSPATGVIDDVAMCDLSADQIDVGKYVAKKGRVLIASGESSGKTLRLPVFGYHVQFTGEDDDGREIDRAAATGTLRRAWDFRLPEDSGTPLFDGFARRYINGYVPLVGMGTDWEVGRYDHLSEDLRLRPAADAPKTLEHIACDDRNSPDGLGWRGVSALMALKGDVDDLGTIFQSGLSRPTFAKMASLSRQMNAFFSVWLPWYCAKEKKSTYTVFAGGDDFFLVGPWHSTMHLAREMRAKFSEYVAGNADIHFSAGLSMTKPGLPIRQLADLAESALERSKARKTQGGLLLKDAVTCFGHTLAWSDFEGLFDVLGNIEQAAEELRLSTGYLYGLQYLADMADRLQTGEYRVEDALWNSRFAYRTRRMLERQRGMEESARGEWQRRLGEQIGGSIGKYGGAFNVALFSYLYQNRD